MKKLKCWDGKVRLKNGNQVWVTISAYTRTDAARAMGFSMYKFRDFGEASLNDVTTNRPEVPFYTTNKYDCSICADWKELNLEDIDD